MSTQLEQLQAPTFDLVEETISVTSERLNSEVSDKAHVAPYWTRLILNTLPVLLADLLALGCSLGCAYGLTSWLSADVGFSLSWLLLVAGLTVPATFALFGLYPGTGLKAVAELGQVALATALSFAILLIAANATNAGVEIVLTLIIAAIGLQVLVPQFRIVARKLASPHTWWGQPVLIFGGGDAARHLYNYYLSHPELGIRPVAIIDDWFDQSLRWDETETPALSERIESLRRRYNVSWAVITTPLSANSAAAVRKYLATFPHILIVPDTEGLPNIRKQMFDCGTLPCIPMTNTLLLPLPRFIKITMDYMLISILGLVCLPLIATIVLLIKITSPGPVFYSQKRIGKGSRPFRAWKFRTMVVNADEVLQKYLDESPELRAEWEQDHKLKNDPRVSAVGRWLRKTSLDELPQLWNVLRGEMSLVGPRPIVTAEIPKYGNWYELYERATPGITGMWQINGRNNTTYEVRVAHDTFYVLNWSPWLDLYILLRTIKVVLLREGAY